MSALSEEVFPGNTGEPTTIAKQIEKRKTRFSLSKVALVGDRGLLTQARLRKDLIPQQVDFITALRAPQIRALVKDEAIQLSLFDERDLFEVTHPDYPGERLIACRNPRLAKERAEKRQSLLASTEAALDGIIASINREKRPLRGKDRIALRVGKVINRFKMAKHFALTIEDESLTYERREDAITAEALLDGIYVLRTSLDDQTLASREVVASYKSLANVERVFRGFNTDLDIRPIRHRTEQRVRTHVFLRMLSYYVSLSMARTLAPMLFNDDERELAHSLRASPVAPAKRSTSAEAKARTKHTPNQMPVHSFATLMEDLSTVVANRITPRDQDLDSFVMITTPTPIQSRAFELLGVSSNLGYV
ncbi:MAG: IS1634 family transposase [Ferrimicrobium sp.]